MLCGKENNVRSDVLDILELHSEMNKRCITIIIKLGSFAICFEAIVLDSNRNRYRDIMHDIF